MKKVASLTFDKLDSRTVIDIWEDEDGNTILGGFGWYEFYQYEELVKQKKVRG